MNYLGQPLDGPASPTFRWLSRTPRCCPRRTLEQNVAFGLDFRHQPRLEAHERQERVRQAIASVGLITHLSKLPTQLSGGMAQRVALARCLGAAAESDAA
ncbi:ATP-binding cassette domain-containing protein [Klebsiella variicola]|nr:ATP-binding cassette domain-containing protein [Klebsiella variicola]